MAIIGVSNLRLEPVNVHRPFLVFVCDGYRDRSTSADFFGPRSTAAVSVATTITMYIVGAVVRSAPHWGFEVRRVHEPQRTVAGDGEQGPRASLSQTIG